jgi:diguanylate cyclase (GGDEF)-like protein
MKLESNLRPRAPRELAVRAIGALGLAGGLLAVVTALLPPAAEGSEALIFGAGAFLAVVGGLVLWRAPALGERSLGVLGVMGTALITITTYEGGVEGGTADNEILYLWIVLYAFYCLSLPGALFQVAVIGGAYGWLLAQQPSLPADQATTQWLVTMTTLTVAGLIIATVRANLYRHVDELSERARHDNLTGLLNRSALYESYVGESSRSRREGTPFSVLAVDVDGFKALNDSLGHARGDQVLRKVATTLQDRTRAHDAVARIGGDEFAVLLSGASEEGARTRAEEMRDAIATNLALDGAGITVSVGVAGAEHPAPSFEQLFREADAAMYTGKREGGNRVCVAPTRRAGATAALARAI